MLNEGAFAQVSCIVTEGDEPLKISWSFHGEQISSNLGIITSPIGTRGSILVISRVEHHHRGTYTCKASNAAGTRFETAELNVNGSTYDKQREVTEKGTEIFIIH